MPKKFTCYFLSIQTFDNLGFGSNGDAACIHRCSPCCQPYPGCAGGCSMLAF